MRIIVKAGTKAKTFYLESEKFQKTSFIRSQIEMTVRYMSGGSGKTVRLAETKDIHIHVSDLEPITFKGYFDDTVKALKDFEGNGWKLSEDEVEWEKKPRIPYMTV